MLLILLVYMLYLFLGNVYFENSKNPKTEQALIVPITSTCQRNLLVLITRATHTTWSTSKRLFPLTGLVLDVFPHALLLRPYPTRVRPSPRTSIILFSASNPCTTSQLRSTTARFCSSWKVIFGNVFRFEKII